MRIVTVILISGILISSCNRNNHSGNLIEGVLTYNISYLENNLEKMATPILPKKMILKFNAKKSVSVIDGFLGFLKIISVTDFDEQRAQSYLKVFDKEFVFIGEEDETICCYNEVFIERITYDDCDTIMAGFNAQKANVFLTDGNVIEVYFTRDIEINNPNANNPYHEIDGVLLDFQLTMNDLKMRFVADNFVSKELNASDFEVFSDPTRISRDSMTKIMAKLME